MHLSMYPSMYPSIYLSIYLCIHPSGYMGDKQMPFEATLAQDVMRKGFDHKEVRDEIYVQVCCVCCVCCVDVGFLIKTMSINLY